MTIQLETTTSPFSISFKRNNHLLMTLKLASQPMLDFHRDESSLARMFAAFTLRLSRVADQWLLTTFPADSPVSSLIAFFVFQNQLADS